MAWIIHDLWNSNCAIVPIIVPGGVVPQRQPIWVEGYLPGVRLASLPAKSIPANCGSCWFAFLVAMWFKRDNIFALLSLFARRLFILVMVMGSFCTEQTDFSCLFLFSAELSFNLVLRSSIQYLFTNCNLYCTFTHVLLLPTLQLNIKLLTVILKTGFLASWELYISLILTVKGYL